MCSSSKTFCKDSRLDLFVLFMKSIGMHSANAGGTCAQRPRAAANWTIFRRIDDQQ